jgi:transposase
MVSNQGKMNYFAYGSNMWMPRLRARVKQFRHIATRYDRNALNYLAMVKIAIVRLWRRFYESTT